MNTNRNKNKNSEKALFEITAKGSLGLLAFGDLGLRAWRKVKQDIAKKD